MVTDLAWGTMTEMAGQYWAGDTTDRVCLTSAPLSHAAGVGGLRDDLAGRYQCGHAGIRRA
jgi:hypothetical protein